MPRKNRKKMMEEAYPSVPGDPRFPVGTPLRLPRGRKRRAVVAPLLPEREEALRREEEDNLRRLEKRLKGRAI